MRKLNHSENELHFLLVFVFLLGQEENMPVQDKATDSLAVNSSYTCVRVIYPHNKVYHILFLSIFHQGIVDPTLTLAARTPWHIISSNKLIPNSLGSSIV